MGRLGGLALAKYGPPSRWAATSNVEVGQTTYPVDRRRVVREGREGSERQSHNKEKRKGGSEMGQETLAREGGLYFDVCASPEFLYSYAILPMGTARNAESPECIMQLRAECLTV